MQKMVLCIILEKITYHDAYPFHKLHCILQYISLYIWVSWNCFWHMDLVYQPHDDHMLWLCMVHIPNKKVFIILIRSVINYEKKVQIVMEGRGDRDCMVVGFTTTCAISADHQ